MVLPTKTELQDSIDSEKAAQAGIKQALKTNENVQTLVKALITASGIALEVAGVPFGGTAANLAKMAIDASEG